jgi:hypothetical protein
MNVHEIIKIGQGLHKDNSMFVEFTTNFGICMDDSKQ